MGSIIIANSWFGWYLLPLTIFSSSYHDVSSHKVDGLKLYKQFSGLIISSVMLMLESTVSLNK